MAAKDVDDTAKFIAVAKDRDDLGIALKEIQQSFSSQQAFNKAYLLARREAVMVALLPLLKIPALSFGMKISTLHKLLAIKCDEVNYVPVFKRL